MGMQPCFSPACWDPGFQAWAQSTCPELSAQGMVPLRWGLPSQAVACPPRLSAGWRESGSQRPWLGDLSSCPRWTFFLSVRSLDRDFPCSGSLLLSLLPYSCKHACKCGLQTCASVCARARVKKPRFLGVALNRDGINEMATLKSGSHSGTASRPGLCAIAPGRRAGAPPLWQLARPTFPANLRMRPVS